MFIHTMLIPDDFPMIVALSYLRYGIDRQAVCSALSRLITEMEYARGCSIVRRKRHNARSHPGWWIGGIGHRVAESACDHSISPAGISYPTWVYEPRFDFRCADITSRRDAGLHASCKRSSQLTISRDLLKTCISLSRETVGQKGDTYNFIK